MNEQGSIQATPHMNSSAYGAPMSGHTLHRPLSQLNLNSNSLPQTDWQDSISPSQRRRQEEEDRMIAEEKERIRLEKEEIARKAAELEREKAEQEARREEERLRKQAEEERERKELERRLREQWEAEDAERRKKWEEEERRRLEEERARWRREEEEKLRRLRMELDDEKFAAFVSMREEMEAEKLKQDAEEKARRAEEAIREEVVKLKEQDEREKNEKRLQEEKDAELARQLSKAEEEPSPPAANNNVPTVQENQTRSGYSPADSQTRSGYPPPDNQTRSGYPPADNQSRSGYPPTDSPMRSGYPPIDNSTRGGYPPGDNPTRGGRPPTQDLPGYDDARLTQANPTISPNSVPSPQGHFQTGAFRPHSNSTAAMTSSPMNIPVPSSSMSNPNPTLNNIHVPPNMHPSGAPPLPHSMVLPQDPIRPGPHNIQPPNHPGFPNTGTGHGPPYFNHFFPHREAESLVAPSKSQPAPRPGPAKLVRPSHSVGGGNPGRVPQQHTPSHPGPSSIHTPGHMQSSASISSSMSSQSSGHRPNIPSTSMQDMDYSAVAGSSRPSTSNSASNHGPHLSLQTNFPPANSYRPTEPLSGIIHGFGRPVIRHQELPPPTPLAEVITLEPEPSPPFFILAHTWRHLLKFMASQSQTRIEPSPAALAREKHGPPNMRAVLHFIKMPEGVWRVILYLAVQSITPPPEGYPSHDTSVVPYLFPSPEPGRPLSDTPETQLYSIPTRPLPILPLPLPNLAPYLQAAWEESARCNDSRSRLAKLINASASGYHGSSAASNAAKLEPEAQYSSNTDQGQKRNFIARIFRPKQSRGKAVNDDMSDLVTPYTPEYQ